MRRGLLKTYSELFSFLFRTADLVALLVAALAAYLVRFGDLEVPAHIRVAILIGLVMAALVFSYFGVYRPWRGIGLRSEMQRVATAWLTVAALGAIGTYLTKTGPLFSRTWFGLWVVLGVVALVAGRALLRYMLRWARAKGFNQRRLLIVGAGRLGRDVAEKLRRTPWAGFEVIGFIDDNPELKGVEKEGLPVLGSVAELRGLLEAHPVDQIWIALPLSAEDRVHEVLDSISQFPVEVRYVPDLFGFSLLSHSMDDVAGVAVLSLSGSPEVGINDLAKLIEDRFLGTLFIVLTAPLMLLIALGTKLTSPGPVLFKQRRYGVFGEEILVWKFRTMTVAEDGDDVPQARRNDPRVTRFGRFLRRTSLDELPQLFNVLHGSMSLVGPRPHAVAHNEEYRRRFMGYMLRHRVKPGITGWAQVNGWRGETESDEKMRMRLQYDFEYIRNWSLWLDLKIILLTVVRGFMNKNAY